MHGFEQIGLNRTDRKCFASK